MAISDAQRLHDVKELIISVGENNINDGIKLQVDGDDEPRIHLTPQGLIKTGDGSAAPTSASYVEQVLTINVTAPDDDAETDTTVDLPANAIVTDVFLHVNTAEATGTTKTIDVGLLSGESGGNADGFLDGASVAATGFVKGTLASGGQTKGVLLAADENGSGVLVPEPFVTSSVTAKSVSVTAASADFEELDVDVIFRLLVAA